MQDKSDFLFNRFLESIGEYKKIQEKLGLSGPFGSKDNKIKQYTEVDFLFSIFGYSILRLT